MEEYICFEAENIINNFDKTTIINFINNYGKNPFIYDNKLFFPKELLNKDFLKNLTNYQDKNKSKSILDLNLKTDSDKLNELYSSNKKEPSGLMNLEGVCYMNAVLQCLYYCAPITNFFLMLNESKKSKLGLVSKGYYNFVHDLFNGNKSAAKNLRTALITTENYFDGREGKDSKDLIIFLLSELHEELKENDFSLQKLNNSSKVDTSNKFAVYKEKIELDKNNKNNSIISDTFNFYILIEYKCNNKNCKGLYSKTFFHIQNENIITFELKNIVNYFNKVSANISLEECLLSYNKIECTTCPYCKTKQLAIKKSICSLPNIFIFIMSRGKCAGYDCKISFPIEIDMANYFNPIDQIDNAYKGKSSTYDLIGATFVYDWIKGNEHEGHTIAFCKTFKNGHFYLFNDRSAKEVGLKEIDGKVPYILFYEKRKSK